MDNNILKMTFNVVKTAFKRKSPVGIAIFGSLILMILLGYLITIAGTTDTVNIGVVNQDQGIGNISAASNMIEELKKQQNINLVYNKSK